MAERTGLEPATTGVTGQYSNQLNYRSENTTYDAIRLERKWWVLQGSNLRPVACKATALPAELNTHLVARAILQTHVSFASLETHCRLTKNRNVQSLTYSHFTTPI